MLSKWRSKSKLETMIPYFFTFPLFISLVLVFIYPLFMGFVLSLYEGSTFVGSDNFIKIFRDSRFWHSIYLTGIYVVLYVTGVFLMGLFTAFIIWNAEKGKMKGHRLLQTFITLPYTVPDVVTCIVWLWLLSPGKMGIVNYLLSFFNIHNVQWFQNPNMALFSVILVTVWRLFPLQTLILLGGFRSISQDVLEAAALEGASGIVSFFYIVLPQIKDIIGILVLITVIWSFKRFTMIWLLTGGGPGDSSELTSIFIYKNAFMFLKRNYAATAGTILVLIVTILVLFYMIGILRSQERES